MKELDESKIETITFWLRRTPKSKKNDTI